MRTLHFMRIVAIFCAAASFTVAQTTRNVPGTYPTIQTAIAVAQAGDTVMIAPGTYNESINFLGKAITVTSANGPATTIIVGIPGVRVVTFATNEGPASILQGLTLTGGAGGIICTRTSPTITNCTITGNILPGPTGGAGVRVTADQAAAVATPTFSNCRITGNTVTVGAGGGVLVEVSQNGTANVTFTGCVFANNTAAGIPTSSSVPIGGGGVNLSRSNTGVLSATFTTCTFTDNFGTGYGGAIGGSDLQSLTLNRCRFSNNAATTYTQYSNGGAISVTAQTLNILGCQFDGNTAIGQGGALAIGTQASNVVNIQNCTIVGNVAPTGSGLYAGGAGVINVTSTILWNNTTPSLWTDGIVGIAVVKCDLQPPFVVASPTSISVDPRFVDAANRDYHLSTTSPCIDAGQLGAVLMPPTDLDGTSRQVGTIDIGADERPLALLPGTNEDFDLFVTVDGTGDPMASSVAAPAGSTLSVKMRSPGQTMFGAAPILAGQFYATGFALTGPAGFPFIQINGFGAFLISGTLPNGPFTQPGIGPGIDFAFTVPVGLTGATLRLQSFGITPFSANGQFATSAAHDLVF